MTEHESSEFEERADQLTLDAITASLADGTLYTRARRKLLGPGAKLLVGPRGAGKTHLMRYSYAEAVTDRSKPLPLYASFSRYLHLEPLLRRTPDALDRFTSWVCGKLLFSLHETAEAMHLASALERMDVPSKEEVGKLISELELNRGDTEYQSLVPRLTVDFVISSIDGLRKAADRSRSVLLLDDAALTLTDAYLIRFFDLFRLFKTQTISPKASVYPGSTQYGPTFHLSQEAEEVSVWLSVEDEQYLSIMGSIGGSRLSQGILNELGADTTDLLKFLAFGIPRQFLRMVRATHEDTTGKTKQQILNRVIQVQVERLGAEYDSISLKLPQFASVVQAGRQLLDELVREVASAQSANVTVNNTILGIKRDQARTPLETRMFRFLVEVGLLYQLPAVSHGQERLYDRYVPHHAFLREAGAFREKGRRGVSVRDELSVLRAQAAKHPLRRELRTLLSAETLVGLKLDLPPCSNCASPRLTDSQRFCHQCGRELVTASLFESCMRRLLSEVPGIGPGTLARLHEQGVRTIGDVYGAQSPSQELMKAPYVGQKRAGKILDAVSQQVEEFLS